MIFGYSKCIEDTGHKKSYNYIEYFCMKKIHKKFIDIDHFELVWTPTAGRGHIPIKRSSRA